MELTRVFALSVVILIASYTNIYLGKSTEKGPPCEAMEEAPPMSADKHDQSE